MAGGEYGGDLPWGCAFVHNLAIHRQSERPQADHRMLDEIKEGIINAYEIKTGRSPQTSLTSWTALLGCVPSSGELSAFADKIMYWDEESGSDTVSTMRQMLPNFWRWMNFSRGKISWRHNPAKPTAAKD